MTDITIAAGGFPHVNTNNLEPGEIWIVANKSYTTPDGKFVTASTPNEGIFVARGAFTIDGSNILHAPALVVDATVNAIDHPDATLTAYIMTTQGRPVSVLSVFKDFRLNSSPTSTNWLEIAAFNAGTLPGDVEHDVLITGDLEVTVDTTLAGLTLALGSDADGDLYMRSGGQIVRVPIGAENATLKVVGGLPVWSEGVGGGASTLLNNLVAYWKLDEASGNRLDSVGSNYLMPVNAPGSVVGKQGIAASFASASSQCLTIADNADLSMTGRSFTLACWVKLTSVAPSIAIMGKWQTSGPAEYLLCLDPTGNKYRFGLSGSSGGAQTGIDSVDNVAVGQWQLLVATYNSATGAMRFQVDNGTASNGIHAAGIDSTALPFQLGAVNSTSPYFLNGAIDEAGIWNRVLTATEITALYAAGAGVTHPFTGVSMGGGGTSETHTLAASDLHDNGYSAALTGYTQSSEFARAVFDTEATTLSIGIYSNFTATGNNIEVRVNGAFHARLAAGTGATTVTTSLPARNKRVEIVSGEQLKSGATITGIFLNAFTTNGPHTLVLPNPAGRLLIYGDSIASGFTSATPVSSAWTMLIRQMRLASTVVEAWGDRSLWESANTPTLRAAFVAHLVAMNPTVMWISIGINDAGESFWSSTNFIAAYSALLDDLHTALPALKIFCQSMTISITQEANLNSFGETFQVYRDKIETAANARAWCEFVDGTTILLAGDIVDNVHPTNAGAAKYARFVANVLHLQ